ncbi:WAT1-related protein isoform X1 [Tanacetum coccineum]
MKGTKTTDSDSEGIRTGTLNRFRNSKKAQYLRRLARSHICRNPSFRTTNQGQSCYEKKNGDQMVSRKEDIFFNREIEKRRGLVISQKRTDIWMEKMKIQVPGSMVWGHYCIGGTLVVTFWRGGFQLKGLVNKPLIDIYNPKGSHGHVKQNWVKGATLISASKVSWSLWLIFQGLVHKMYPAPFSMNIMISLFASLQSSILAIFFARDVNMWKLEWDVKLLAIIYSGIVVSGLTYYLVLWAISKRGPVFAAMFSPLQLPIVGVFSAIVFNERLHIGSLDDSDIESMLSTMLLEADSMSPPDT